MIPDAGSCHGESDEHPQQHKSEDKQAGTRDATDGVAE
jgi:hypothetical protein